MDTNRGDDAFDSALIPLGRDNDDDDDDDLDGLPASAQQPFTPSLASPLSVEQQQREQQQQRWQQRWQQDTGVPPPSSFPSPTTTTNPEIFVEASPARTPPPRSPTPDGRGQLKNIHLEQKFNEVFGELEGVVTDFKDDFVRQGLLDLLGDMKHVEDVGDQLAAEQASPMQRNQDELERYDDWRRANAELESVFN